MKKKNIEYIQEFTKTEISIKALIYESISYWEGTGVEQNRSLAIEKCKAAYQLGSVDAMTLLIHWVPIYLSSLSESHYKNKNKENEEIELEKVEEQYSNLLLEIHQQLLQTHPSTQTLLFLFLLYHEGSSILQIKPSFEKASYYLKKGAELKDMLCLRVLAYLYLEMEMEAMIEELKKYAGFGMERYKGGRIKYEGNEEMGVSYLRVLKEEFRDLEAARLLLRYCDDHVDLELQNE